MDSTNSDFKRISSHNNNRYSDRIHLTIVKIDRRVSEAVDELNAFRKELFILDNYLRGTDIRELTDTKPGEKTPVDAFWRYHPADKKKDYKCDGGCS